MFITPAYMVALSTIRVYAADLDEVWRLISTDTELAEQCCEDAAAAVNQRLEVLLFNASLEEGALKAWKALRIASTSQKMESSTASFDTMIVHAVKWDGQSSGSPVESMLCQALETRRQLLGLHHPLTLSSAYSLACFMYRTGGR